MGRPRKHPLPVVEEIHCRVLIPNLWTSKGKFLKGEEVTLPADEAETLDRMDKIKRL